MPRAGGPHIAWALIATAGGCVGAGDPPSFGDGASAAEEAGGSAGAGEPEPGREAEPETETGPETGPPGAGPPRPVGLPVGWDFEEVEVGIGTNGALSLAIGPDGRLHVAFYTDEEDLRHVYQTEGGWAVETVKTGDGFDLGDRNAIAVDPDGVVWASWRDYDAAALWLASRSPGGAPGTGAWEPFLLVDGLGSALDHDIAFGAGDDLHVTVYAYLDGALHHATNASGSWTTDVLDAEGDVGGPNALALSPDGEDLHALAYAFGPAELVHVHRGPEGTTREVVDVAGKPGQDHLDLTRAPDGTLHAAYYAVGPRDLRYASRDPEAPPGPGAWTSEVLDSEGDTGDWCSIAAGPDGTPHVAWRYYDGTDFRYARRGEDGWQVVALETKTSGKAIQVAVDPEGTVHVVFESWGTTHLVHARLAP